MHEHFRPIEVLRKEEVEGEEVFQPEGIGFPRDSQKPVRLFPAEAEDQTFGRSTRTGNAEVHPRKRARFRAKPSFGAFVQRDYVQAGFPRRGVQEDLKGVVFAQGGKREDDVAFVRGPKRQMPFEVFGDEEAARHAGAEVVVKLGGAQEFGRCSVVSSTVSVFSERISSGRSPPSAYAI